MVTESYGKITIKPEIRLLGIDDSKLVKKDVLIIGTVFRGSHWMDGVMRTTITKDGMDGTEKLIDMIINSRHYKQVRAIILDGITYAGFNILNIKKLYTGTNIPVIVIMRKKPDFKKIKKALSNLSCIEERWKLLQSAGEVIEVFTRDPGKPIYIQCAGLQKKDAIKIVKMSSTRSNIPEPLRAAHLIATGVICGESKKRA
ncbi:MAG: hypothetical protein EMLJLAPB_00114 [Candidatus Argoarchaeum ethanivorans]|uniref:UPF0215 protein EMLJLAPB_00114 n=1 Tax=Candidatus Argoarchaeum ethanivorans TaxID=2608793 RepID=A0A811T6K9_9EURY|nr:MAG: hypothetical protein EMLJLAPB_00114 [Candidatus Argoarchaeum ethanivorans]